MTGYSGTPLAKKLGLTPAMRAAVANAPWPYAETLGLETDPIRIAPGAALPEGLGFLHLFTTRRAELEHRLQQARHAILPTGMIWVS